MMNYRGGFSQKRIAIACGLIFASLSGSMPAFAETEMEALKRELAEQKQLIQSLLKAQDSQKTINAKVEAQAAAGSQQAANSSGTGIPGVTFFGAADVYVASASSGFGSKTIIGSGGMTASAIGVKAERDLGNGLKAIGTVEAAVALDTGVVSNGAVAAGTNMTSPSSGGFVGTGTQIFARQAFAGLSSAIGSLTIGRQYTGSYITAAVHGSSMGAAFFGNGATLLPLVGGLPSRLNNSIVYLTPKLNGFAGHVTYTTGSENNINNNTEKAGQGWDAAVTYAGGPIGAALSTWNLKNTAIAVGETELARKTGWQVAGNYNFGIVRLYGNYVSGKIQGGNYENITRTLSKASGASISAAVPFGKSTVYVNYSKLNDDSLLNKDGSLVGIAYTYQLYEKTKLYASWGKQTNNSNSTYSLANGGDLVGNVTTAGVNPTGFMTGVNIQF